MGFGFSAAANICVGFTNSNCLWKSLCLHLKVFRALQGREDSKCRSNGGPWGPTCLLGFRNAVDEEGNSTCTKSSVDAELGRIANTKEDREIRKICKKYKDPDWEMKSKSIWRGVEDGSNTTCSGCCKLLGVAKVGQALRGA